MPIKKEKPHSDNDGKTPRREKERGKGEKSLRAAQHWACASTNSEDVAGDRSPTAQNSLVDDPAALPPTLPGFFATRRSRKARDGNTKLSHTGLLLTPRAALAFMLLELGWDWLGILLVLWQQWWLQPAKTVTVQNQVLLSYHGNCCSRGHRSTTQFKNSQLPRPGDLKRKRC